MISQSFLPSPSLRSIARAYHIRHFRFDGTRNFPFKAYPPRPQQCLTFYPRECETVEYVADGKKQRRPHSMILNQYTVRTNRHTARDFIVIIVDLQPGILYRFTGLPLHEFTNIDIDAEAIFSPEVKRVNERLNSTPDYHTMISIVETFLLQIAAKSNRDMHAVDKVANFIIQHATNVSLDRLADQACLSSRQFERIFKARMGVGPKTFSRITRLHQTYKMRSEDRHADWLDIALACGYYDYHHLVKDYKEFANATPVALFQVEDMAPEKQLGMKETF